MIPYCRGLALGIALTVYGREEEADTLIEQMTRDQDPILRYGGMYALALAYSGTANNKAILMLSQCPTYLPSRIHYSVLHVMGVFVNFSDRFLPDKAIDLVDEAGSRVRLRHAQVQEVASGSVFDQMRCVDKFGSCAFCSRKFSIGLRKISSEIQIVVLGFIWPLVFS
ncbi:hypothetical protein LOK49_LG14G02067 [Camellia lanceoleosa]|uniref:Uncharacterized protein n=1 Tax=Camellia lanceoleosa TaxID=1840588 RepID=A0ACC0FD72_9ERIC|nr:hypothetical protein LOK49_LG14G02067 [Camellia lanceoleosa]